MKYFIATLVLFFSLRGSAQLHAGSTFIVTNEAWNCGGYTPKRAKVVSIKGRLYVRFVFDEAAGNPSYKTVKAARRFWKWQETTVVRVDN